MKTRMVKIRYVLVDANTSYNVLLEIPTLNLLGAISQLLTWP